MFIVGCHYSRISSLSTRGHSASMMGFPDDQKLGDKLLSRSLHSSDDTCRSFDKAERLSLHHTSSFMDRL